VPSQLAGERLDEAIARRTDESNHRLSDDYGVLLIAGNRNQRPISPAARSLPFGQLPLQDRQLAIALGDFRGIALRQQKVGFALLFCLARKRAELGLRCLRFPLSAPGFAAGAVDLLHMKVDVARRAGNEYHCSDLGQLADQLGC